MRTATLSNALLILLPLAIFATTYIYTLYPLLHKCEFPAPTRPPGSAVPPRGSLQGPEKFDSLTAPEEWEPPPPWPRAPLRLLALADPQLEGDTSVAATGHNLFQRWRKRLDLLGNDFFLAHVAARARWWTKPTHTVVLGDLLGSQWIDDAEFGRRAGRFWGRLFGGRLQKVPADLKGEELAAVDWSRTVIAVAGNHDIGYAGDLDAQRVERFERAFGPVNWAVEYGVHTKERTRNRLVPVSQVSRENAPRLNLVVLNSMNLDGPARDETLRQRTEEFLKSQADFTQGRRNGQDATVLLTHIPLYKQEGVCADGPYTTYFDEQYGGGVKEQNHLGRESSQRVLDGLFGQEDGGYRKGLVLDGHDHEGCDVLHSSSTTTQSLEGEAQQAGNASSPGRHWTAAGYTQPERTKTERPDAPPGVREITVRSMMGSHWGAVGLLSGWWDDRLDEWRFEYKQCVFGPQHVWWAVHVLDLAVLALVAAWTVFSLIEYVQAKSGKKLNVKEKEKKTQ